MIQAPIMPPRLPKDRLAAFATPRVLHNQTTVPCRDTDTLLEALAQIRAELGTIVAALPARSPARPRLTAIQSLCAMLSPLPPKRGTAAFDLIEAALKSAAPP